MGEATRTRITELVERNIEIQKRLRAIIAAGLLNEEILASSVPRSPREKAIDPFQQLRMSEMYASFLAEIAGDLSVIYDEILTLAKDESPTLAFIFIKTLVGSR